MMKTIIFDLDGTLIDTIEDLGTAVNHAMMQLGHPTHTMAEYSAKIGDGVRNLVTRALPETLRTDRCRVDEALGIFKAYYSSHIDVFTKPYPGIPEMLHEVKRSGIRIAVATNKFQEGADKLIGKLFPDVEFDLICGNREGMPLKPDASVVRHILAETATEADDAIYVGDTEIDMLTASNGGVRAVGVTWGYRNVSCLTGADTIANTVEELQKIILAK